jgi:hypothetical protein
MRTVILYHPQSDHVGLVETYSQDFIRFKGRPLELVSLETAEGAELAKLYDIVRYPAILAIGPDGALMHVWQGGLFPLMDELYSYMGDPLDNVSHEGKKILNPVHNLAPPTLHAA